MAGHLLDLDEVEMLRTQAILSGGVCAANINGQPLVAVHNLVMPLPCFVTVWMWVMLDSKVYSQHTNSCAYDTQLLALNPHCLGSLHNRMTITIYLMVKNQCEAAQIKDVHHKKQTFVQVLRSLGMIHTHA